MQNDFIEGYARFHSVFLIKSQVSEVSGLRTASDVNFVTRLLCLCLCRVVQSHLLILIETRATLLFEASSVLL